MVTKGMVTKGAYDDDTSQAWRGASRIADVTLHTRGQHGGCLDLQAFRVLDPSPRLSHLLLLLLLLLLALHVYWGTATDRSS